jgi:hypothetical protein
VSVALYVDEHVPSDITRGLRKRGVDVLTVQDEGREGEADPQLLDRATELGRVMFTRDSDFLKEASRRQASGEAFAGVIYAHQLRVSIGECISDLELLALACEPQEFADQVQYLPISK